MMSYTLIFITLTLACIFIIYINKGTQKTKEDNKIGKQYNKLTEFILSEFPNCEIIKEDNASITIGYEGVNGSTYFYIERKSKMISILYRTETTVFGKHELEWKFYEPMEQETIITKIKKDISDYNTKIKVDF